MCVGAPLRVKNSKNLQRIREFLRGIFFAISAPNTSFASPNAAPTQTRVAPTSELCAAQNRLNHSRLWRAARQNRKNAATDSNVVDANFAQVHRRTRNFSPIERTSDAASSFGPIFNCSQRRRLQVWCVARQKRKIFPFNDFVNFCAENLHDLGTEREFCVPRHCADSDESCVEVETFLQRAK